MPDTDYASCTSGGSDSSINSYYTVGNSSQSSLNPYSFERFQASIAQQLSQCDADYRAICGGSDRPEAPRQPEFLIGLPDVAAYLHRVLNRIPPFSRAQVVRTSIAGLMDDISRNEIIAWQRGGMSDAVYWQRSHETTAWARDLIAFFDVLLLPPPPLGYIWVKKPAGQGYAIYDIRYSGGGLSAPAC